MRLIVIISLFLLLDAVLVGSIVTPKKSIAQVTPSPTPSREIIDVHPINADKLFQLEQAWRITDDCRPGGCQPYKKDERLCAIAKDRVENDPILDDHKGFYRKYSSYPYVLSENLSTDDNEHAMLGTWLGSPDHAATLRKPYTSTCIYCRDRYCSQIFSSFLKN